MGYGWQRGIRSLCRELSLKRELSTIHCQVAVSTTYLDLLTTITNLCRSLFSIARQIVVMWRTYRAISCSSRGPHFAPTGLSSMPEMHWLRTAPSLRHNPCPVSTSPGLSCPPDPPPLHCSEGLHRRLWATTLRSCKLRQHTDRIRQPRPAPIQNSRSGFSSAALASGLSREQIISHDT